MGSSGSKLADNELHDLLKKTKFSKAELKATYKYYMQICPDGEMGPAAMTYINREPDSWGIGDDFYDIYFKAFVTNNPSWITFKEYMLGLNTSTNGTKEERLKWTFKVYDQQKAGKLTYDDIYVVQKAMDKRNGIVNPPDEWKLEPRCKRFFSVLDKDPAVDTIGYDEFKELFKLAPVIKLVEIE